MSIGRLLLISAILLVIGCGRDSARPSVDPAVEVFYRDDYPDPDSGGVKDFTLVSANGSYHIFHIGDPRQGWTNGGETQFVHATSPDLIHWTKQSRVDLRHPDWSRTNLWSPFVLAGDGVYYMFYTGVEWGPEVNPDHPGAAYNRQRIGLAISSDLFTWTRVSGNSLILDGPSHQQYPWSAYGTDGPWRNDCRDPFVLKTGDHYLLFAAIRLYDGEALGPMAIAVARSSDLQDWTWESHLPVTQGATAESPFVIERGGFYYLFWTGAESRIRVARSAQADGGYARVSSEGIDYGYAADILIEPDRYVWGAVGRGDEYLEPYVLQFKKMVFAADAAVPVRAEEFTQSEFTSGLVLARVRPGGS